MCSANGVNGGLRSILSHLPGELRHLVCTFLLTDAMFEEQVLKRVV